MKLSIIVINYNTFELTCNCLRDIFINDWNFLFEVILVDNASNECDSNNFKIKFPLIKLIKSGENGGFARGNNIGIAAAQGMYLLVLNSDTLSLSEGIKRCISYMDLHKDIHDLAGVGCKILSLDGSRQNSAFDYRIGLKSALLDNSIVGITAKKMGYAKYRSEKYVEEMHEKEHAVQALLGAFILFRKDVIDIAKALDPDFFLYYEELEWCYRINDAGYRIMYIPDVSITHIGQGTSSTMVTSESTNKQHFLSKLLLIFKQGGYFGLIMYNMIFIINYMTNIILLPLRSSIAREAHKAYIRGVFFSLKYQWVMLKHFNPKFASSKFPFKLSIVEELSDENKLNHF